MEAVSHYRILKKLGAGGMGEVYLAEDLAKAEEYLPKTVKILPFDPKAHYELALLYSE